MSISVDSSMTREEARIDYDDILTHIGDLGPFQKRICVLLSLISAVGGLAVVVFPFTGYVPNYRCRVHQYENNSSSYFASDQKLPSWFGNLTIVSNSRCRNLKGTLKSKHIVQNESKFFLVKPGSSHWATADDDLSEYCSSDKLVFDDSVMASTLVQDFDLVCDKSGLRAVVNVTYMLGETAKLKTFGYIVCITGLLVGAYLIGWISDCYGRLRQGKFT